MTFTERTDVYWFKVHQDFRNNFHFVHNNELMEYRKNIRKTAFVIAHITTLKHVHLIYL